MQLLKILAILASTKDKQIDYIVKLGTFPSTDEFALEFDDAYKVFLGIIDEKENDKSINPIFINKLSEIDFIFETMSSEGNDDFWNISSLSLSEWNKIRELAKEALVTNEPDRSDL